MNTDRVLSVVVVVLAGTCVALGYRLWIDHARLAAQASTSTPHVSAGVQIELQPTSAPHASTSVAAGAADSDVLPPNPSASTGPLATWPSWLPIPDEKKELLLELWGMQSMRTYYNVHGNGMTRAEADAQEQKAEENRRQAALQIERLLGPQLNALWKEYQDTMEARSRIVEMNGSSGIEALPEDKARSMALAMTQAAQLAEIERQARYGDYVDYIGPATLGEVEMIAERERRKVELMREVASRYLYGNQLQAFDQAQMQALKRREKDDAITKARLEARAAAAKSAGQ